MIWARLKKRGQFHKDEGLLTGFLSVISNKKKKENLELRSNLSALFFKFIFKWGTFP